MKPNVSWIKWGIWFGGIISISAFLINQVITMLLAGKDSLYLFLLPFEFLGSILVLPISSPYSPLKNKFCTSDPINFGCTQWSLMGYIIVFIFWLIIGLIVGKIKNRNKTLQM